MNKRGMVTIILISIAIAGILGFKLLWQDRGFTGEIQPAEDAVIAVQEALAKDKAIFLMFTGENCPACIAVKPWVEQFYQEYHQEVEFIIADVYKGGSTLAMNAGVQTIPHFFYIDSNEVIIENFSGYPSDNGKEYLENKIKSLIQEK